MSIISDIKAIAGGFGVTLRHMLRRPVTIQYPEEKRTPYPRFRARIVLTRDPDGGERCVACYLCSAACPVDCISMQSAEQEDGRRYAAWFRINFSRCIFCGLCVEACPEDAIRMVKEVPDLTARDRHTMWIAKEELLTWNPQSDVAKQYPKPAQRPAGGHE